MKPNASGGTAETAGVFDPRVLVFACNWCSYAGADTAGVSRLQHSPHFRLLRVMCSGRIHSAFVLRAFAQGADGVMVSGCHLGDCHYMFGNYRAAEQFEKTQALARLLGLKDERLRLEWISAAEGIRFAQLMNEFVEQVRGAGPSPIAPAVPKSKPPAADTASHDYEIQMLSVPGVFTCLECGRCTGVCPVARYQSFSPRRLISRALSAGGAALIREPSLWACLTCNRCQTVCPTSVDYDRFILAARTAAVLAGNSPLALLAESQQPEIAAGAKAPADAQTKTATLAKAPADAQTKTATPAKTPTAGPVVPCSHGGVFEQISLMMARPGLRQKRLAWVTEDMRVRPVNPAETLPRKKVHSTARSRRSRKGPEDLLYVGCSPYFAAYFGGETGNGLTETMRSVVRLLNRVGITPALLENERCCGYHLRLAGRNREADELEVLVLDQIRRSGARRVITFCPECLVALRQASSRHGAALDVVHLSTLLWGKREVLANDARGAGQDAAHETTGAKSPPTRVTFQDPCRLGRYSRIYDAPRDLLTQVSGAEVVEMAHSRENAICCGNTAWLNCNAGTKRLQTARLEEAVASTGERMLTACPGCFIHLRCTQEGLEEQPAGKIPIEDVWNFLASRLPPETETTAAKGNGTNQTGKAAEPGRNRKRRKSKHE